MHIKLRAEQFSSLLSLGFEPVATKDKGYGFEVFLNHGYGSFVPIVRKASTMPLWQMLGILISDQSSRVSPSLSLSLVRQETLGGRWGFAEAEVLPGESPKNQEALDQWIHQFCEQMPGRIDAYAEGEGPALTEPNREYLALADRYLRIGMSIRDPKSFGREQSVLSTESIDELLGIEAMCVGDDFGGTFRFALALLAVHSEDVEGQPLEYDDEAPHYDFPFWKKVQLLVSRLLEEGVYLP